MRITGGLARGIALKTGTSRVRPATDRMREAVFSSLGQQVAGAQVLDLFAGSGAYGFEALSRGATNVTFVERDRRCMAALEENAARVARSIGREVDISLSLADVTRWTPADGGRFDLIFADPPYPVARESGPEILERIGVWLEVGGGSRLVFEMPGNLELENRTLRVLKRIGKTSPDAPSVRIYGLV